MANTSILAAFERMWQHTVAALGNKIDASQAAGRKTSSGGEVFNDYEKNIATADCSHAEGYGTTASSLYQHVQGKYNIEDSEDKYAHIVGNGESNGTRSNAHTLDWDGNAWYAGSVESTGIKSNGNIEFGNTSNYLSWTTNDNTQIHMRPYAPTNVFQITMQNPGAGITEYGALSIYTNGKIELGGPLYTQGLVLKYKETYGSEADMYSIANPVEG